MNKVIIPVIASILILGTIGLSQEVFAFGSISFMHPSDGDSVKGKKLAVVAKISGLSPDERFQTQFVMTNPLNPQDRIAGTIDTDETTPVNLSSFTFIKNITADNPNGTVVILVDTDALDGSAIYEIQMVVTSYTDPTNRAINSMQITLN